MLDVIEDREERAVARPQHDLGIGISRVGVRLGDAFLSPVACDVEVGPRQVDLVEHHDQAVVLDAVVDDVRPADLEVARCDVLDTAMLIDGILEDADG